MERNMDFNNFSSQNNFSNSNGFNSFDSSFDNPMYETPMINPIMQYEQTYMYYKYLTQQMEYKIKCKEFDRLNSTPK